MPDNLLTKLSSFIITFNEENLIERNVKQLEKISDEIIIVDSYSTDNTVKIIEELQKNNKKIKLYFKKFEGYGQQKSFAESMCENKMILNLDADEILSENLIEEILELKKLNTLENYDYYILKIYLTLNHQKSANLMVRPDKVARLYNKTKAKYLNHSTFDRLILNKNLSHKTLNGTIYHYSIKNIYENLLKQLKYQEMLVQNDKKERNILFLYIRLLFEMKFVFLKFFFLRRMFALGFFGFYFSIQAGFLATYKIFQFINKKT